MNIINRINKKDINRARESNNNFIAINNEKELNKYTEYVKKIFNLEKYVIFERAWSGSITSTNRSDIDIDNFPIYARLIDDILYQIEMVKTKPSGYIILNRRKKLY